MPEDLQQLLSRINDDYLKQAEKEKSELLERARSESAALVAEAETKAAGILAETSLAAETMRKRAADDIRRAARDGVRELRTELNRLLEAAVKKNAAEAMTPAFMAEIIRQMAEAAPAGSAAEAAILTNPRNIEALRALIPGTLRAEIAAGEFKGGMQLAFDRSGEYFDFSDDAVCNFLRNQLSLEFSKLLDA